MTIKWKPMKGNQRDKFRNHFICRAQQMLDERTCHKQNVRNNSRVMKEKVSTRYLQQVEQAY